jgi:hypothetical protein
VANETIYFGYLQVGPLDDLVMAGVTSQPLAPSEFLEMSRMIKGDVFEDHILSDICLCVTSWPEAIGILYLMVESFNSPPRNDICEPQLHIREFRPEVIAESGLIVAFDTRHISVR